MDKIKQVMDLFQKSNLSEMELELEEFKIKMKKNTQVQVVEAAPQKYINRSEEAEVIEDSEENNYEKIESKLVGTFYSSNVQDGDPLVNVGDHVSLGQVIGVIEAMKVMNEIKSPYDGIVKKINVKNNQMVQYDEVIMEIEADD